MEINGQTLSDKKQDDTFGRAMGGMLVVVFIVFYLGIKEYQSDDNGDAGGSAHYEEQVSLVEMSER